VILDPLGKVLRPADVVARGVNGPNEVQEIDGAELGFRFRLLRRDSDLPTAPVRFPAAADSRGRQIQPVEAFASISSVNSSEGFFQL
jgi:hypothetical protein